MQNLDILKTITMRHFGDMSEEDMLQAAVDNFAYSLMTVSEQRDFINRSRFILSYDAVMLNMEALTTMIGENLERYVSISKYDQYQDYSNLNLEAVMLINKILDRALSVTDSRMQHIILSVKESDLRKKLNDAFYGSEGSMLDDKTGDGQKTYVIYYMEAGNNREITLGKELAGSASEALIAFISQRSNAVMQHYTVSVNGDLFYGNLPVMIKSSE